MNVILVLIDSLNRHSLSCYNESRVATPNLDAFAKRAWRFDKHYVGSLPCMPARREISAGIKELMWRPWGPLEYDDPRLAQLLLPQGCSTAIVTDHYHYWEEAANGYIQAFQSAELIRGHEIDFWQQPLKPDDDVPAWVSAIDRWRGGFGRRYFANIRGFTSEADFFPARVMTGAANWLRQNADKAPFFLQVESFDVHEPFHCPEPYRSMYTDGITGEDLNIWPPYQNPELMRQFLDEATPEELAYLQAQYDGKLTMVDTWLGRLFAEIEAQNLWDETVVIVTTDHGHDLGQHRKFGKQYPHYDTHAHIPLLVWHPDYPGNGQSISQLTQTVDLFATVLDLFDAPLPERTHSRSFLPLLRGDTSQAREALLYGTFGQGVCATDGEWTIFKSPAADGPLNMYSTMLFQSLLTNDPLHQPESLGDYVPGAAYPRMRIPIEFPALSYEDFLFHTAEDAQQTTNLWNEAPDQRARMTRLLVELIRSEGAPPEQFTRLGLRGHL